jgi:menaquinol-cytochrome c reductase iron-sulfur subunit
MATKTEHGVSAGAHDEVTINRRRFLTRLSLGLSGLGAALVGVPVVGFLLAPLLRQVPEEWQTVGPLDQFAIGEAKLITLNDPSPLPWAGVAARTAAWLRRDSEQEFVAFAVNCTHLGCPVRWLQDASLFMCPCHGGVFYKDGSPAAGPPPRPLTRYEVRVRDGQVEVLPNPVEQLAG